MTPITVEFEAYSLKRPDGTVYHTIPPEICTVGIQTRRNGETELAFIRHHGAWLPPFFWRDYAPFTTYQP